jgi:glutamate-1-semialdehyde 2,1-aminomutase
MRVRVVIMGVTWQWTEQDRAIFDRELESFVPGRVYDMHAHLYRASFWPEPPPHVQAGPSDVSLEAYREHMAWILPGREVHGLHFPYPYEAEPGVDLTPANEWVAAQVAKDSLARGQFMVKATDNPEWVRGEVRRLGLRGLKPFAFYGTAADAMQAEIPDYLPEPIVAVANEEGWSITLHLVRSAGVADASNQHWIRSYCRQYPNMQLILDHCARGFNPYHVLRGLPALAGLDNLWIDTSAVCNSLAVEAALAVVGPQRMLYGSDFYVSHMRGTNFPVGDTFLWIDEASAIPAPGYVESFQLPLVGIDNLRAVKAAFWSARLSDSQVDDYFWNNAARLLGLS